MMPNSPLSAGGVVSTYSASPALPEGLDLSPATGVISGTATAVTAAASYTITASNAGGSVTALLTLAVIDAPVAQLLPNMGQHITPLAPPNSQFQAMVPNLADHADWRAGQAVTTVVSPDHKTLLVLTSGFNRVFRTDGIANADGTSFNWPDSKEYVFVYDISTNTPVQKQVLSIPNTYNGIAFDPSGTGFYVSSGMGDSPFDDTGTYNPRSSAGDNVHVFTLGSTGTWAETPGSELVLGNAAGLGLPLAADGVTIPVNLRVAVKPCAAGVAISGDGKTLAVADYYNDALTVFNGGLGQWSKALPLDLRPGKSVSSPQPGVPGGEYPFWVAIKGNGPAATAYVSSVRDREIDVVSLSAGPLPVVTARIKVKGQPNKMTLNAAQSLLYVVEDQSDTVDVIDTTSNTIVETIPVIAPSLAMPSSLAQYKGANPNSVTLSPDEKQLYVTNGNLNAVAVVALGGSNSGDRVVGLIPTGWYPNSVSFSGDGKWVYVVNGKSPTGANPDSKYSYGPPGHTSGIAANEYNPQLIKAGLQSFPRPTATQLATLTEQVAANNRFSAVETADDAAVMAAVRKGIKHVVFIIKENRTYDQILGDLGTGNGDPSLAEFGEALTPNQHSLARSFVALDNFLDTAEVSNDGWPWTTSAKAPDVIERQFPVTYAGRGLSLDSEGVNRNVNVAYASVAERQSANPLTPDDADLLAGQTNVAAPDGPDNEVNTGYLWDSALRAQLTVRNYGFFLDTTRYAFASDPNYAKYSIPLDRDPFSSGTTVAYPASVSLAPYTDPYFRGFDNSFPDYYRYVEWAREFDNYDAAGGPELPALSLVRFMHDHTGNYASAIDRVNTPELQQADNDYAVGLLVQKIARSSRYADNTLIFVIEDDAQDGPDHMDSHRSVVFVAGAYVKRGAVVSSPYNTINFVRTIEEVLGLSPMNLNDALARPMADVFNTTPSAWSFTATPSAALYDATDLPLPPKTVGLRMPRSTHDAKYWARVTKDMDFATEDHFDFASYNRILWRGLMGHQPYPSGPTGLDLRQDRAKLLVGYQQSVKAKSVHARRSGT
jgi:DNA-binding beta-propeller fold protein YncE